MSRNLHHSSAALDPTTAPIEIIQACLDAFADKSFSLPFQRKYAIRLPTMNFQNFIELVSAEYDRLIHTKTAVSEFSEFLVKGNPAPVRDTALLGTVSPPLVEPLLQELSDRDRFPSALAAHTNVLEDIRDGKLSKKVVVPPVPKKSETPSKTSSPAASFKEKCRYWHGVFGHASERDMLNTVEQKLVDGLPEFLTPGFIRKNFDHDCEHCVAATMSQKPLSSSSKTANFQWILCTDRGIRLRTVVICMLLLQKITVPI